MKAKKKVRKAVVRIPVELSEREARAITCAIYLAIHHAGLPPKKIANPLVAGGDRIMQAFGLYLTVSEDGCVDAVRD